MWFAGMLVGLVVGAAIGHDSWLPCAALGGIAGWFFSMQGKGADQQIKDLSDRINALSVEIADMKRRLFALEVEGVPAANESVPPAASAVAEDTAPIEAVSSEAAMVDLNAPPPWIESESGREEAAVTMTAAPSQPFTAPHRAPEPAAPNPIVKWLLGGNTVVRVGIVILFFGVAFLLKYAYEHTHVPIAVRMTGVAIGAIAMLAFGWRLRERRAGYALTIQGGGIGVLYLNIFAAFRLYDLIPPTFAFALLVGVVVFSALLAILQDSLALAVLGVSGGFLAPVLISTGQGSHVMLFSYYLVLNLGIFAISWYKPWRALNLVGFGFTFVISSLWGAKSYAPEFFASTEPFLVVFFLLYVSIQVLFARRQAEAAQPYVDGTLVFGVPLVAFGLQLALVKDFGYGAAWSAFALAAFYILLASLLWRESRARLRLLCEAFLALGVCFGTLAIPLAFDGRVTSAAWALEGAAIVWVGMRQQRVHARSFGLFLQLLSGIAFLSDVDKGYGTVAVLNGGFMGCTFVAIGGLFCSAYLGRHRDRSQPWERGAAAWLLAWGALWWTGGGLNEIVRHVLPAFQPMAMLLFLVVSAAIFSLLSTVFSWRNARWPAYAILPAGALFALQGMLQPQHPAADLGWLAWPATFVLHLWVLRREEGNDTRLQYWLHAAGLWLFALIASRELGWQIDQAVDGKPIWPLIAWAIIPCVLLALATSSRARSTWPVAQHEQSYLLAGALPLAIFIGAWTLFVNFTSNGDPAPLPYIPLFNPLDIVQGLVFLVLGYWVVAARRLDAGDSMLSAAKPIYALFGAAGFIWANGVLLRTLHHWAGVPFELDTMLRSVLVQAAFSLFWTLLALTTMVLATRRAWRGLWIVGAVLMAVVVAKLFLVDLSGVGGIERIVSFIGVGMLMLVVGYFSPVPPVRAVNEQIREQHNES